MKVLARILYLLAIVVIGDRASFAAQGNCPVPSGKCPAPFCSGRYQGIDSTKGKFPMDPRQLRALLGFDPCSETVPGKEPDYTTWSEMKIPPLRAHVWDVWAAINAPSRYSEKRVAGAALLPKWRTWYSSEDLFCTGALATKHPLPTLQFDPPPQTLPLPDAKACGPSTPGKIAPGDDHGLVQVVLYNAQAAAEIARCCSSGRIQRHPKNSSLEGFSSDSVALKTLWLFVPQQQCRSVPVWDGVPRVAKNPQQGPETWPRSVNVCAPGAHVGAKDRRINSFYWVNSSKLPGAPDHAGFMILVGMHVITHEIPDWVWATFWWHDHPTAGEFAANRTKTPAGPWANYLMDVAFDMDRPWQSTGLPKAIFNPYLEGTLVNGTQSNCIACHRRAVWPVPTEGYATPESAGAALSLGNLVVTGRAASLHSYLPEPNCGIHTAFLWSIALLSAPKPDNYEACPEPEKLLKSK